MCLFCNSRIYVITLYSGHVCVYYASMLRCWHLVWILVRTDHPCLEVGCHTNGSQGEVVDYDLVGDEEVQEVLKTCLFGDIKPQVGEASTSSTTQSMKPNVDEEDKEVPPTHSRVQVPSTQVQDQVNPIVQSSSRVQDNHAQPP
jgi:hypothetical protein